MFGMGGSEILVILIVALLFLGPDKLPEAAKQISKGIRDIKKQSRVLQRTIEDDEHIGGAIRDLKSALRGEDEPIRPTIKAREQIAAAGVTVAALAEPSPAADGDAPSTEADPHPVAPDAPPADADAPVTADAAEAPKLRMPATAGEPDEAAPRTTAADDAELAALVKPAPNTIARGAAPAPAPSDPSEPEHG